MANDAATRLLDDDERLRHVLREDVAAADRGEFFEDAEVRHWLEEREHSA